MQSELEREREEGLEARQALEADLSGHRALVEELQEISRATEAALKEREDESARVQEDAARVRDESAEIVAALQQDLQGHQAVLRERSEELNVVRGALGDLEGQHEVALRAAEDNAVVEQKRLLEDLEAHRAVMIELRSELEQNVSAREGVEVNLRRVEEMAQKIEAELRGTQDALHVTVQGREVIEVELQEIVEELGGERETLAFMREEMGSRWKNLVRALLGQRRKY